MGLATTTKAVKLLPSAAAGVSITDTGAAWTNSGWVQFTSGLGSAVTIVGILPLINVSANFEFEFEIGKGTAGSEVVVSACRGCLVASPGGSGAGGLSHALPLVPPVDNIPISTRIAGRLRVGAAGGSFTHQFVIAYVENPPGFPTVTVGHLALPPAAAGATVAPSATPWANSAWVQISSGGPSVAAFLTAVSAQNANTGGASLEIDIGQGAAGSEVVKYTVRKISESFLSETTLAGIMAVRLAAAVLAASTRVAARVRASAASGTAPVVALTHMLSSGIADDGKEFVDSSVQKALPSAAVGVTLTPSATAWANSAWVQLTASSATAVTITGVSVNQGVVAVEFEIEIGNGAAGSEVVVTTFRGETRGADHNQCMLPSQIAVDNIPTATRIAVRMRKAGTSTAAWTASLLYLENPVS